MGTQETRASYAALVLEHPNAEVWAAECDGQPRGQIVGQPVPDDPDARTEPGLRSRYYERTGTAPDTTSLAIQQPGVPYQTGTGRPATVIGVHGNDGEVVGWMPPYVGLGSTVWAQTVTAIVDYAVASYDAETLWQARLDNISGTYRIRVRKTDKDGTNTTLLITDFEVTANTRLALLPGAESCLLLALTGNSLVICETDASTVLGITSQRWAVASVTASDIERISAARRAGQAVLFASTDTGSYHLASYDDGYSWQLISTPTGGSVVCDVCASAAGFHALWLSSEDVSGGSIGTARVSRMAASASPWLANEYSTITAIASASYNSGEDPPTITGYGMAITATEDQRIVVTSEAGLITQSVDFGGAWDPFGAANMVLAGGTFKSWLNLDTSPAKVELAHRLGHTIAGSVAPGGANAASTLRLDMLGGYWSGTSAPEPYEAAYAPSRGAQPRSYLRWVPHELPGAAWADTASGSGTETLGSGRMRVTSSARHYSWSYGVVPTVAHLDARSCFMELRSDRTLTGADSNGIARFAATFSDGSTNTRRLRVTLTSDTLAIYEDTDGSPTWSLLDSVAHGQNIDGGTSGQGSVWFACIFGYTDDSTTDVYAKAWVGARGTGWAEAISLDATGTTDISSAVTTNDLGMSVVPGSDTVDLFTLGRAGNTAANVDTLVSEIDFGEYQPGRPLSPWGTYVRDGITVEPTPGVGTMEASQGWDISSDYLYPFSHALDPSPRTKWQPDVSTDKTHSLAIRLDGVDQANGGSVLAICLFDCYLPGLSVDYRSGGVWAAASFARDLDGGLSWRRDGSVVRKDSAAGDDLPLVRWGEFDGAVFAESGAAVRRIARTQGGKWVDYEAGAPARLWLEDADSGDTASGTDGSIEPRQIVVLFDAQDTEVQGVRINIDASSSGDFQPELGRALVGWLRPLPQDPGWDGSLTTQARTTVESTRDGEVRTRVDGPSYRVVQVSWQDGTDTLGAVSDGDDPPWFSGGSSDYGDALVNTTQHMVEGLFHELSGPARQVVYLPRVSEVEANTSLIRRHEMVLGRVDDMLRQDRDVGDTGESYLWRFSLTITEDT